MDDSFMCGKCSKVFGYQCNLLIHEKKCSAVDLDDSTSKKIIKCPDDDCGQSFSRYELLRKHVAVKHQVSFNKQVLRFQTPNDFKQWKEKVEKENHCFYAAKSTARTKSSKRTYYYCHRSGYFTSRSKGIRRIKSQGTNKIDSTCTSSIVTVESSSGIIEVDYCDTHFGHESNIGRCRLTAEERAMLAGKSIARSIVFQNFRRYKG